MTGIPQTTRHRQARGVHKSGRSGVAKRSYDSGVVGLLALITMALALVVIASGIVVSIANAMKCWDDQEYKVVEVTVMPGDTLWGIAREYSGPEKDIRVAVDDIMRENNLSGSIVRPGQVLRIAVPIGVTTAEVGSYKLRGHELADARDYTGPSGK